MVGRISNHKDLRRRPWKNLWENTQSRKSLPFDGYWHRGDCQLGRGQKAWRLQLSALAARKMENLSTISYDVVPTIQRRMLRLCDCLLLQGTITWGATVWSSLSNPITTYESTKGSSTFFIRQGKLMLWLLHPYSEQKFLETDSQIWDLISGTILWVIWKNRCKKVFKGKLTPLIESVKEIWAELINNLRSQYDSILGDSNATVIAQLGFLQTWAHSPFFKIVHSP